jgi:hypothetical protein
MLYINKNNTYQPDEALRNFKKRNFLTVESELNASRHSTQVVEFSTSFENIWSFLDYNE